MINEKYLKMLGGKSVIRNLSEYATKRGQEIVYGNVFDFSLGNPSVKTPDAFNEACIRMLREMDSMSLHGYSPTLGIPEVKEQVAESLDRRFGMDYTAEHIFPTSGAAGALAHALRAVTRPGDKVLVFAPFFPEYVPYINDTGAEIKVVPADFPHFQINFDALEESFTADVAAVLINSPNNPSGVVYSELPLLPTSAVGRSGSSGIRSSSFPTSPTARSALTGKQSRTRQNFTRTSSPATPSRSVCPFPANASGMLRSTRARSMPRISCR